MAGLRALETIALRYGAPGRFLVQEELSTRSRSRPHSDDDANNDAKESPLPTVAATIATMKETRVYKAFEAREAKVMQQ